MELFINLNSIAKELICNFKILQSFQNLVRTVILHTNTYKVEKNLAGKSANHKPLVFSYLKIN